MKTQQPGHRQVRARYQEADWIAEVLVVEDLGDRDREAYRLKVLRTLQAPAEFRPVRVGRQFLCDQARDNPDQTIFTLKELPRARARAALHGDPAPGHRRPRVR